MKELHKIYRKYAQTLVSQEDTLPRRLFLVVRLSCPRGSYDVNIEPTKDEVMFEDMGVVTELFEKLCKRTYGEIVDVNINKKSNSSNTTRLKQNSFDILLAKTPAKIGVEDTRKHGANNQEGRSENDTQLRLNHNVRNLREESSPESWPMPQNNASTIGKDSNLDTSLEAGKLCTDTLDSEDEVHALQPQIFNPFVLAKVNTRISQPNPNLRPKLQLQSQTWGGPSGNGLSDQEASFRGPGTSTGARETPKISSSNPSQQSPATVPFGQASRGPVEQDTDEVPSQSTLTVLSTMQPRTPEVILPSVRTPAVDSSPSASPLRSDVIDVQRSQLIEVSYASARQLGNVPIKRPGRGGAIQQPFRTPFKKVTSAATPNGDDVSGPYHTPMSAAKNCRSGKLLFRQPSYSIATSEAESELDDIMEFEHRKREHILQHRSKSRPVKEVQNQQQCSLDGHVHTDQNECVNVPSIISSKALYEARFSSGDDSRIGGPSGSELSSTTETDNIQRAQNDQLVDESSTVTTNIRSSSTVSNDATADSEKSKMPITQMHPSDPRAFLIRSQAHAAKDRPAGKLAKSRTTMLPFESIIGDMATHRIRACLERFDTVYVSENHCSLQVLDAPYARSGIIQYSLDESPSGKEILEICKVAALRMIDERGNQSVWDENSSSYSSQQ